MSKFPEAKNPISGYYEIRDKIIDEGLELGETVIGRTSLWLTIFPFALFTIISWIALFISPGKIGLVLEETGIGFFIFYVALVYIPIRAFLLRAFRERLVQNPDEQRLQSFIQHLALERKNRINLVAVVISIIHSAIYCGIAWDGRMMELYH